MLQETKEATNYYFCYRWLLILFKREFSSYEEVSTHRGLPRYIAAELLHHDCCMLHKTCDEKPCTDSKAPRSNSGHKIAMFHG